MGCPGACVVARDRPASRRSSPGAAMLELDARGASRHRAHQAPTPCGLGSSAGAIPALPLDPCSEGPQGAAGELSEGVSAGV
jgi:hypothetical protein